ncbi:MAG: tetratricopeptide repeat protein [Clostridia bacterium]
MRRKRGLPLGLALAASLLMSLAACVGTPPERPGTSLGASDTRLPAVTEKAEVERLIALGSPSALEEAVTRAANSTLLPPVDAQAYAWVAYELARLAYPELAGSLPPRADAPPDHALVRAFIDARNGRSAPLGPDAGPLFELLPVIGVFRVKTSASYGVALVAAERFSRFGMDSALGETARGMALEASGDKAGALVAYTNAESLAPDVYTASLGRTSLLISAGRVAEAMDTLSRIGPPANTSIAYRRAYAHALYASGKWTEALPLITAVLLEDPMNSSFMLMRAHLLIENGEYRQALPLLDAYARIDALDRLYLILRARYAMDGSKDRGTALATIRRALERYPDDAGISVYAAELLYAGDTRDRAEALVLAARALTQDPASVRALKILLSSDIASGNAEGAVAKADAILAINPAYADFETLYKAYRMAGINESTVQIVQAWRAKEPLSESATQAWLGILVETGKQAEALELITRSLASRGSPAFRSTLYWYQSRLQSDEEQALALLRSALIENGMNVDALAYMADIYIRKTDYQRARFYLRQAMTIAPDRPDIVERRNTLTQLGVALP